MGVIKGQSRNGGRFHPGKKRRADSLYTKLRQGRNIYIWENKSSSYCHACPICFFSCGDLVFDFVKSEQTKKENRRESHEDVVLSSMETVMSLVLEESEEVNPDLISLLLNCVKKDNQIQMNSVTSGNLFSVATNKIFKRAKGKVGAAIDFKTVSRHGYKGRLLVLSMPHQRKRIKSKTGLGPTTKKMLQRGGPGAL
ncbi:hypothetical protein Syun_029325 [Stephania yunnanensis]|uniref:Uncharacterized protein n=1 Tax=Stephania yunnanensis TaxID=152371 RepID=A0AAP0E5E6_9MAGN